MAEINKIPDFEALGKEILKDAESYAAVTGLNFFKASFEDQGFTDTHFEAWQSRKNDYQPDRAILISSSALMNSLQILERGNLKIKFGTYSPYAGIHNSGGTITVPVTAKSRKFFWFMWYLTGIGMYKALAITKKDAVTVHIPKRQFIGESQILMNQLDEWILNRIVERFKQI